MSEQRPLFHFEISERKVLLRLFDNVCVLLSLSLIGIIFDFDYFRITSDAWTWTLIFLLYFNIQSTTSQCRVRSTRLLALTYSRLLREGGISIHLLTGR